MTNTPDTESWFQSTDGRTFGPPVPLAMWSYYMLHHGHEFFQKAIRLFDEVNEELDDLAHDKLDEAVQAELKARALQPTIVKRMIVDNVVAAHKTDTFPPELVTVTRRFLHIDVYAQGVN